MRFAFLASTPEREGEIAWKAVQRYDDDTEVAWIDPPGSETPAPVTRISASAPRQNAGGEGAEAATEGATRPEPTASPPPDAAGDEASDGDDSDTVPLVLGALGVVLARPPRRSAPPATGAASVVRRLPPVAGQPHVSNRPRGGQACDDPRSPAVLPDALFFARLKAGAVDAPNERRRW